MEKLTKYIKLTEFAVYNETVETPDVPGTTPPKTGDTVLTVGIIALVATAGMVIVSRRRKVTE